MDNSGVATGQVIMVIFSLLFYAIVYVWFAFALSKVFAKIGEPTWQAWVPVVNLITIFRLGGQNPLWLLAFLVPIVNLAGLVFLLLAINNINKRFGFGVGYTIIAWVALPVWASILGFGSAAWHGPLPATAPDGVAGPTPYENRVGSMVPPAPPAPPGAPAQFAGPPVPPGPPAPPAAVFPPAPPAPSAPSVTTPVLSAPPAPPVPQAMVVPGSIADSLGAQSPADSASATVSPHTESNHPEEISAAQNNAAPKVDEPAAPAATGDPWAPPISTIPGVTAAAPTRVTPPPVSLPPVTPPPAATSPAAPVVEPQLVPAPPATPAAVTPPVPPVPPAASKPIAAPPAAAPPAAPELLPDFDDTIIADDLPDFDDTVIVGRKTPVWILEPGGSKPIRITSPMALLGRNPSVNAAFPDAQLVLVPDSSKTMSKNHARIALDDGVWTIYDLGSTNGVVLVADGEETVLESGASATLTETFKLGELPIRLTPEL